MARARRTSKTVDDRLAAKLVGGLADQFRGHVKLGDGQHLDIPGVISTRCPTLDAAIGRGGVPLSRLTILTGEESTGKTTLALHLVAEVQKMGGVAYYMDLERKLDRSYMVSLGINLDDFVHVQPETVEEAFAMIAQVAKQVKDVNEQSASMVPCLVVIDSVNAAIAGVDLAAELTDKQRPASLAAAISRAAPKMIHAVGEAPLAVLIISQVRMKIGKVVGQNLVGGGRALPFYAAVLIHLIHQGRVKEGTLEVGNRVLAIVRKNQIAMPMRKAEYQVIWGEGVDYNNALLTRAVDVGLVRAKGAGWYEMEYSGEILRWQGDRGFARAVQRHEELVPWMEGQIAGGAVPEITGNEATIDAPKEED